MVGAFEDEDVTHVEGDVNPVRDLDIISSELRLKDMEYLGKRLVRGGDSYLLTHTFFLLLLLFLVP